MQNEELEKQLKFQQEQSLIQRALINLLLSFNLEYNQKAFTDFMKANDIDIEYVRQHGFDIDKFK